MSFQFQCPHCNAQLEAEEDWIGSETTCPNCSQTITIRRQDRNETTPPQYTPPPAAVHTATSSAATSAVPNDTPLKSRKVYLLLGILLGWVGAHDFYAGYTTKGVGKLAISLCTCCMLSLISSIWAIIDVCTITEDAEGRPFVD